MLLSRDVVVPVARALRELGADVPEFQTPALGIDVEVADRMMDRAATELGDDVGPRAAQLIPLGALGPVDYALSTSATVGDGLDRLSRYYGVATDRIELAVLRGDVEGIELGRQPSMPHSRHWIEFSLALILGRVRAAAGTDVRVEAVCFVHDAPRGKTAHDSIFGTQVVFGAASDRLVFPRGAFALSFQTSSPLLGGVLERKLDEIESASKGDVLLRRVRETIAGMIGVRGLGVDAVARRMSLSKRSLQRHLGDRETSFKEIVDDIRRERAAKLVEGGTKPSAVASELGFADPSAFFRAYRRWTGETPSGRSGK